MSLLNISPDQLLTTTRTVRKRLDLTRPVEPEVVRECLEIAIQAPSGSNRQDWHFVIITDADKRIALADLYRRSYYAYRQSAGAASRLFAHDPVRSQIQQRIGNSGDYLADNMHKVPVLILPCFQGRIDGVNSHAQAGTWGSILPATWSLMLAARARGLGTAWTTLHLAYEKEAAAVLGIPYDQITQAALIPMAYTLGTDFKPAPRQDLEQIMHWEQW